MTIPFRWEMFHYIQSIFMKIKGALRAAPESFSLEPEIIEAQELQQTKV